eukprot:symbB.v1.2.014562.t1/scaffold1068.1/size140200/3
MLGKGVQDFEAEKTPLGEAVSNLSVPPDFEPPGLKQSEASQSLKFGIEIHPQLDSFTCVQENGGAWEQPLESATKAYIGSSDLGVSQIPCTAGGKTPIESDFTQCPHLQTFVRCGPHHRAKLCVLSPEDIQKLHDIWSRYRDDLTCPQYDEKPSFSEEDFETFYAMAQKVVDAMVDEYHVPMILDQATISNTNNHGHPPHADNLRFDSVWRNGQRVWGDELAAARSGAYVLWREEKTSYRSYSCSVSLSDPNGYEGGEVQFFDRWGARRPVCYFRPGTGNSCWLHTAEIRHGLARRGRHQKLWEPDEDFATCNCTACRGERRKILWKDCLQRMQESKSTPSTSAATSPRTPGSPLEIGHISLETQLIQPATQCGPHGRHDLPTILTKDEIRTLHSIWWRHRDDLGHPWYKKKPIFSEQDFKDFKAISQKVVEVMSLKFNRPLLLDQAAVNCTNKIGHPPHADNVQFDSVWWKGRQIQQRDEVEAAQAGADVLWKSSKTTSYRNYSASIALTEPNEYGGGELQFFDTWGITSMFQLTAASCWSLMKCIEHAGARLEGEIKTLYEYLTEDGMPGVSGPLVDDEGFPRGDIDLYAVRQARNKYVCAQTDHIEIMRKIEQAIAAIHATTKVDVPREGPATKMEEDLPEEENENVFLQVKLTTPFATIDEVSQASPAEAAGLRVGDQVCRFGPVSIQDTGDLNACFNAIRELVPQRVNTAISVVVLRGEPPVRAELELVPRQWPGRGPQQAVHSPDLAFACSLHHPFDLESRVPTSQKDKGIVPTSCGGHSIGLAKLLGGARHPRAVYAQAAQKLRWRGGLLTAVEFEYFSVREIGLDLETARKAFRACLEAQARSQAGLSLVPILQTATSCVESSLLAEALEDCAREEIEDPGFVLEARLELEAAAGELRLFAAELRPRELPKDTLLAQLNAREAELGHGGAVPSPMATLNKLSNSKLTKRLWSRGFSFPADEEATILGGEDNSVFFLRFGLCASRDVYPNAAEVTPRGMLATPRLNAPEASWIVPHIVFVSQALTYARLPPTGTWCVQMPHPEDSAGCLVPVCTCARLCDAQKAAFSLL